MARYRPPAEKSAPYITEAGYRALQQELQNLWPRRREVTQALSAAAAEGDRSENAEYIYRKKELRELDRRIRYLQKRLPELKIVQQKPNDPGRVFFGAWVTLEDEQGRQTTYRIVGADELNSGRGYITIDSPMAKALLRKVVEDEVTVSTPGRKNTFLITAISYHEPGQ